VIVGGGVCGLTAAWRLRRHAAEAGLPLEVTVVEADARPGGKVVTERLDGFVVEGGPDSFLASKPRAAELARELGLGDRLVGCAAAPRRVWVARGGRLVELPAGLQMLVPTRLGPFLASPLFSWRGKARILAERWVPARRANRGDVDESLAAFVRRRFGSEALERLADPVTSSLHLGDPERLSLEAVWPACAELERRFGSVARGVRAARAAGAGSAAATRTGSSSAPAAGAPAGSPTPSEPPFLTLAGGLGELVDALVARLRGPGGAEILTGRPAAEVRAAGGAAECPPWTVRLAGGEQLAADAVVLALPAFAAAELVAGSRPELAAGLAALPYASAATVALGYRPGGARLPEGFGFFVPAAEGRALVAATFASTKFEGRAPAGGALVRAFVGGARGERWAELPEAELVAAVRADLQALLGLAAEPALVRVHRWPRGYPQYEVGHRRRVAALEALCGPGLYLAGSAFHGAGLPDTVASAERAAAAVVESMAATAAGGAARAPEPRLARA
jgi:oxygen-dependent protoporphyrinogen oxidase